MVSVDQKMLTELQASFFSVKEEQGKEKKQHSRHYIVYLFYSLWNYCASLKEERSALMRTSITY